MSDYAAREEEARQHTEELRANEEAATQATDAGPAPDAEIARVHRSGRQHSTDTAVDQRQELGRRRPRR